MRAIIMKTAFVTCMSMVIVRCWVGVGIVLVDRTDGVEAE